MRSNSDDAFTQSQLRPSPSESRSLSTNGNHDEQGKKYADEFIGTFGLVLAGTGAIIINDVNGGAVSNVGIGLTFGLIVLAMIYAIGDVSGAHLNPAVTLGFFAARRLEGKILDRKIESAAEDGVKIVAIQFEERDPTLHRLVR